MDQFFGLFASIVMSYSKAPDCVPRYHYTFEYEYVMPEGLYESNNWKEKSYHYFDSIYGFGGEIGYGEGNIDESVANNRKYYDEEIPLADGAIKFYKDLGFGALGEWEVEILVPVVNKYGEDKTVIIMIAKQGDSQAYTAFEEKALQLARTYVQGESHAREIGNCDNDGHPFWSLLPKW